MNTTKSLCSHFVWDNYWGSSTVSPDSALKAFCNRVIKNIWLIRLRIWNCLNMVTTVTI